MGIKLPTELGKQHLQVVHLSGEIRTVKSRSVRHTRIGPKGVELHMPSGVTSLL
jgi:hypothetical protein